MLVRLSRTKGGQGKAYGKGLGGGLPKGGRGALTATAQVGACPRGGGSSGSSRNGPSVGLTKGAAAQAGAALTATGFLSQGCACFGVRRGVAGVAPERKAHGLIFLGH